MVRHRICCRYSEVHTQLREPQDGANSLRSPLKSPHRFIFDFKQTYSFICLLFLQWIRLSPKRSWQHSAMANKWFLENTSSQLWYLLCFKQFLRVWYVSDLSWTIEEQGLKLGLGCYCYNFEQFIPIHAALVHDTLSVSIFPCDTILPLLVDPLPCSLN